MRNLSTLQSSKKMIISNIAFVGKRKRKTKLDSRYRSTFTKCYFHLESLVHLLKKIIFNIRFSHIFLLQKADQYFVGSKNTESGGTPYQWDSFAKRTQSEMESGKLLLCFASLVFLQSYLATNQTNTSMQTNQSNQTFASRNFTKGENFTLISSNGGMNMSCNSIANKTSWFHPSNISTNFTNGTNVDGNSIFLKNGSLMNFTTTIQPATVTKKIIFLNFDITLDKLCTQLNIPDAKCKCPQLGAICLVLKKVINNEQIFVCTKAHKIKSSIIIGVSSIGIVCNLLCLLVTAINEKNTICRKIIGMLSFADLTFSALQLAAFVPELWTCEWICSALTCKFLYSMINSTAIMALGFILIISLGRFNGIVKPFLDKSSNKKVFLMILLNISFSVLFVIPTIVVSKVKKMGQSTLCRENWSAKSHSLIYSWFILMATFVIPIGFISYLYLGIVRSLKNSQNDTQRSFSKKDQSLRRKENGRITTIIAYLLISFAMLVSPNRIIWVLNDHGVFSMVSSETRFYISLGSMVPYTIHACVNPIIYSIVEKKFREGIFFIFYKLTCQRKAAVNIKEKCTSSFNPTTSTSLSKSSVNKRHIVDSNSHRLEIPPLG